MKKTVKLFVINGTAAAALLLVILLAAVNLLSFTMAAEDADRLTMRIAEGRGTLKGPPKDVGSGLDRMGPGSPELLHSTRYFTYCVDTGKMVAFNISAFTEEEAKALAEKLFHEKFGYTGWTNGSYRYRIYEAIDGKYYVTVVDQGRELLPSYRILIVSVIGGLACLAVSAAVLTAVGKKLFRPLEEVDRRQKQFAAVVESDLKVPITVISADVALIERENGESARTDSIRRQIGKVSSLVEEFGELSVFGDQTGEKETVNVSELFSARIDEKRAGFYEAGVEVITEIQDGVSLSGDSELICGMLGELVCNAVRFGRGSAVFTLSESGGRVTLTASNGTELSDRRADQAFDRFVRLENAAGKDGRGLGLSYVRDVARTMNGRVTAYVRDGQFTVELVF